MVQGVRLRAFLQLSARERESEIASEVKFFQLTRFELSVPRLGKNRKKHVLLEKNFKKSRILTFFVYNPRKFYMKPFISEVFNSLDAEINSEVFPLRGKISELKWCKHYMKMRIH